MKVLEAGCGTGSVWLGHDDLIARCGRLVLTDFSAGMLEAAKSNLGERSNLEYQEADIQNLPFRDDSFDAVIANAMLYHVPNIEKGIGEVRRVLKKGGVFYCATYGEHSFSERLAEWFRLGGEYYDPNYNFTMENGERKLRPQFEEVTALFYEDSFHITDIGDLLEYLHSLVSLNAIGELPDGKILEILKSHSKNGAIDLPKEYGMFICR
ncbi:MAG: class I SAM-dependent methyltransferase [Oscillospiraceae bacterium]|nr:class I SAM-dependent methyltransferase [Oscillospiraceae bacterium]